VIVVERYRFNRHVWDIEEHYFPTQRKFVMGIYCIFTLATGLIKLSVLLFYRRLSSRAISPAFRWTMRIMMVIVGVYTIAFVLVLAFACRPLEAFWEQVNLSKSVRPGGYQYQCINEGADVVANGIAATAQDFIVAFLPTLLCWNLQMPIRQKFALYGIFAIGYSTVAIGAVRTYTTWRIYFESYDVTWIAYDTFLASLLEMHIGAMCANAPALKVLFKDLLASERVTKLVNSRSNKSRSNSSKNMSSSNPGVTGHSAVSKSSAWVPIGFWKSSHSHRASQCLSDSDTNMMIDKHGEIHQLDTHPFPGHERHDSHSPSKFAPEFADTIVSPHSLSHDVEMGTIQHSPRDSRVNGLQALPPVQSTPGRKYSNRETYFYSQSWAKPVRSLSPFQNNSRSD
jgi:hypothetical protein